MRLSRVGNLRSVPETLLYYTLSKNSVSARNRALMIQNNTDLLKKLPINPSHVKDVQLDYEEYLYRGLPNAGIRQLLFIRDISTLSSFYGETNDLSLRRFVNTFFNYPDRILLDSANLISYKIVRNIIRRLSKHL